MSSFEVEAELREDKGKGASRRLRRSGQVPAILYGGRQESRSLVLNHAALLRHLENEAFYSHILNIKVGKTEQAAILKDVQRHPAKRQILHVDFQRVLEGEKIKVRVPLHFLGEDEAPGRKQGGIITHIENEVEINVLPKDLPEYLEIDVSNLDLDDTLNLSDIRLPEGVELTDLIQGRDGPVVSVSRPQKEEEEAEPEVEGIEGAPAPEDGAEPSEDSDDGDKRD